MTTTRKTDTAADFIKFRVDTDERIAIDKKAQAARLTRSEYIRQRALADATTTPAPAPSADISDLARQVADLARQIADKAQRDDEIYANVTAYRAETLRTGHAINTLVQVLQGTR